MKNAHPNLGILEKAVERLGPLTDEMVFLGGNATSLLLTDPGAAPARVTLDIDVIIKVTSQVAFHRLSEKLRARGFSEDLRPGAPICRWTTGNVILDVMPTRSDILGFGNRWYAPAHAASTPIELPSGKTIKIVSPPYFIATKLEAFDGRGKGDYLLSNDLEDVITVLDGRRELLEEVKLSENQLKRYLSIRFKKLLEDSRFMDALPGLLRPDHASQSRLPLLISRIKEIIES